MYEFLRIHQLNIMLILGSVCGTIAFFAGITKSLSVKRRWILVRTNLAAMLLLYFDRFAYIFRGDETQVGYWMVRISNFLVFMLTLLVIWEFNHYVIDLFHEKEPFSKGLIRLNVSGKLCVLGLVLVVVSQFTGLYYTFDHANRYQRSELLWLSYVIPMLSLFIQLSAILQFRRKINKKIWISLLLFSILPVVASIMQIFLYGISLTNITIVGAVAVIYIFAFMDMNETVERANQLKITYLEEEQKSMERLFDQVATAFVNTIDAKDIYTQGHSIRVAEYSREIAKRSGKDERACKEVYYSALLHDVGKISIPDSIINKQEELTAGDIELIKQNPVVGNRILSGISEFPYISVGAHYHNEWYDGSGYPEKLKGEEIPEIARIISVADAYDTMISGTSYKLKMPSSMVREEIVKGIGTQFDPKYAEILLQMIDHEKEFMLEKQGINVKNAWEKEMKFDAYRSSISKGVEITRHITKIRFDSIPDAGENPEFAKPSLILFDSFDGLVHTTEKFIKNRRYVEYGEIWFDGHIVSTSARNMNVSVKKQNPQKIEISDAPKASVYEVELAKYRDHARLRLFDGEALVEVVVALPDSSRRAYVAITGERCFLKNLVIEKTADIVEADEIPRIADEISYIDRLKGDIPNIQIDGDRTDKTEKIPITDGLRISFHTMSLPTASLVWHCPYVALYEAGKDGDSSQTQDSQNLATILLHGEMIEEDANADCKLQVKKSEAFVDWDSWKEKNKKGYDGEILFRIERKKLTVTTTNAGISIKCVIKNTKVDKSYFAALTGNQCALTNIRVL